MWEKQHVQAQPGQFVTSTSRGQNRNTRANQRFSRVAQIKVCCFISCVLNQVLCRVSRHSPFWCPGCFRLLTALIQRSSSCGSWSKSKHRLQQTTNNVTVTGIRNLRDQEPAGPGPHQRGYDRTVRTGPELKPNYTSKRSNEPRRHFAPKVPRTPALIGSRTRVSSDVMRRFSPEKQIFAVTSLIMKHRFDHLHHSYHNIIHMITQYTYWQLDKNVTHWFLIRKPETSCNVYECLTISVKFCSFRLTSVFISIWFIEPFIHSFIHLTRAVQM